MFDRLIKSNEAISKSNKRQTLALDILTAGIVILGIIQVWLFYAKSN